MEDLRSYSHARWIRKYRVIYLIYGTHINTCLSRSKLLRWDSPSLKFIFITEVLFLIIWCDIFSDHTDLFISIWRCMENPPSCEKSVAISVFILVKRVCPRIQQYYPIAFIPKGRYMSKIYVCHRYVEQTQHASVDWLCLSHPWLVFSMFWTILSLLVNAYWVCCKCLGHARVWLLHLPMRMKGKG